MSEEEAVKQEEGEIIEQVTVKEISAVPVNISAVLGRSAMTIGQVLGIRRGAVIELDKKVGDLVELYLNNKLIAYGEIVIVEDRIGITLTEVVVSN